MSCTHVDAQFEGLHSLVGVYICPCGVEIDPVEFHRMHGRSHVQLGYRCGEDEDEWYEREKESFNLGPRSFD